MSKGGFVTIDDQIDADVGWAHLADRLGRLALDLLEQWYRHLIRKRQVELAGFEGQQRRRAVRYDRVFDPVEIRPPFLAVFGVARDGDPLVGFEFGELKGPVPIG